MGSGETIDWAAEKRYPYLQTYTALSQIPPFFNQYRQKAEECGVSEDVLNRALDYRTMAKPHSQLKP